MILVTIGALNVVLWTLQQQNMVTESIIEKSNSNLDKLNEDIEIANVRIDNDKLNMTITNTGGAAATLKSIYIINETASEQYRYDLDVVVDGRDSQNVGPDLPLIIRDDTEYSIRLITESGNTVSTSLIPLSSVALPMSIYVIPPTVRPGDNVTVLFAVTNNLTDSNLGIDVTPTLEYDPECTPGPGCEVIEHVAPSGMYLTEGNTMLFKWVFEVDMPDETYITFNASLAGARAGNYALEDAYVKLIEESQISTSTTQVIYTSLVQKPEIFLVLPSPFGENSERGLWGVVVSNPTEVPMEVSRIVISAYSTLHAQGSQDSNMIPSSNSCEYAIYPGTGDSPQWTCPHVNMVQWRNTVSPETVDPLSSKSFLVRVLPGPSQEEPAFMVSVAVFTNMGQFTKTGYSSGMSATSNAIANVFMSKTDNPSNAYTDSNILTHINGIVSGSTVRVNVTLVDFDKDDARYIKSGTKLVINVPTDFTQVDVIEPLNGFSSATATQYDDGSTQIVAELSEHVGNVIDGSIEAKVLTFTARAPIVTSTKVYIMYALLDGESNPSDFSVGALAEMPLQVMP